MRGSDYRRTRRMIARPRRGRPEANPQVYAPDQPPPGMEPAEERSRMPRIGADALLRARAKVRASMEQAATARDADVRQRMFQPYTPPPKVIGDAKMAMDDNSLNALSWATAGLFSGAAAEGMVFLGYPELAVLAQRAEYRRISEIIATEMTRKWIKLQAATADDDKAEDKSERIGELDNRLTELEVQRKFRTMAEQDGWFGRSHLYIELESSKDPAELIKPIGPGNTKMSKAKCGKGDLRSLKPVEAVWCYPNQYNSNDPLSDSWYRPETWQVMGKQIHHTRLLTFVGREVPDLLKAAYAFGGLSLTQMARPYVDNWLRSRQSVSDLVYNFSTNVLKTDMAAWDMDGGEQLFTRVDLFNAVRNNRGTMVIDKVNEEWDNVAVPLGGLDALQQQAQEHIASVCGIPIVKLLGIQPSGLNASSEGEIRVFYDWIGAYQEKLFRQHLQTVIWFAMLDLWGEIDEDITFIFEPLMELTVLEKAQLRKTDADTGQVLVQGGILHPEEERKRVASDPDMPYAGLDVEDVPEATPEEAGSLEPGEGGGAGEGGGGAETDLDAPGAKLPPGQKAKVAGSEATKGVQPKEAGKGAA